MHPLKSVVFSTFLLILAVLAFEGLARAVLWAMEKKFESGYNPLTLTLSQAQCESITRVLNHEEPYYQYDAQLGWSIRPLGTSGVYAANAHGFRGPAEVTLMPADNMIRLACFGDSFTHCDEVDNHATWEAQMMAASPGLEVLNFGVGGYGLVQAFERYKRDGERFSPHGVLIGIMPENIYRNLNTYVAFYWPLSDSVATRPAMRMESSAVRYVPNPLPLRTMYADLLANPAEMLPVIGEQDYYFQTKYLQGWYRPSAWDVFAAVRLAKKAFFKTWFMDGLGPQAIMRAHQINPAAEAYQVMIAVCDAFAQEVAAHHAIPVFVLFPDYPSIIQYRENKVLRYQPLADHFEARNYAYVDLMPVFSDVPPEELSRLVQLHYTPEANQRVARQLLEYLLRLGVLRPEAVGHTP